MKILATFNIPGRPPDPKRDPKVRIRTQKELRSNTSEIASTFVHHRDRIREARRKVVIIGYRKKKIDHDVFVLSCQPIFQGLVDVQVLVSDNPAWCKREYHQICIGGHNAIIYRGVEEHVEVQVFE